jgi:hypothetical protein
MREGRDGERGRELIKEASQWRRMWAEGNHRQ